MASACQYPPLPSLAAHLQQNPVLGQQQLYNQPNPQLAAWANGLLQGGQYGAQQFGPFGNSFYVDQSVFPPWSNQEAGATVPLGRTPALQSLCGKQVPDSVELQDAAQRFSGGPGPYGSVNLNRLKSDKSASTSGFQQVHPTKPQVLQKPVLGPYDDKTPADPINKYRGGDATGLLALCKESGLIPSQLNGVDMSAARGREAVLQNASLAALRDECVLRMLRGDSKGAMELALALSSQGAGCPVPQLDSPQPQSLPLPGTDVRGTVNLGTPNSQVTRQAKPESAHPNLGQCIAPPAMISKYGERQFHMFRSIMLHQQEMFTSQLYELHRLVKMQKCLASELSSVQHPMTAHYEGEVMKLLESCRQQQEALQLRQRFLSDIALLKNLPSSLRSEISSSPSSQVSSAAYKVPRTRPGVLCPVPSRMCSSGAKLPSDETISQPTVMQSRGKTKDVLLEAKESPFNASIETPAQVGEAPSIVQQIGLTGSDEVAVSGKEQVITTTRSLLPQLPVLFQPPPLPPMPMASRLLQGGFGGGFDPHAFWFAKHYDNTHTKPSGGSKGAPGDKPCQGSAAEKRCQVEELTPVVGAAHPGPGPPGSSSAGGAGTSKVLRWWQDATQTFGEPGLMDSRTVTRPTSPVLDQLPGKIGSEVTSSFMGVGNGVGGGAGGTPERHTAPSKSGKTKAPPSCQPLKKRARYQDMVLEEVMMVEESGQTASAQKKAAAGGAKPMVPKVVKLGLSAFKKVANGNASGRSKRGSNKLTRTESIGSDNSASSFDKGGAPGNTGTAKAAKGSVGFSPLYGQSTAKSAAGILLSLSSSYHATGP